MISMELKTPTTDPTHYVIGNYLKGIGGAERDWKSEIYWCDSYDPRQGYWLTSLTVEGRRINVSERAIDASFHIVWHNNPEKSDSLYCNWGKLQPDEVELIQSHVVETGFTPRNLRIV